MASEELATVTHDVMLSFRCPKPLASALVRLARTKDVKASDVIRAALHAYLLRAYLARNEQ